MVKFLQTEKNSIEGRQINTYGPNKLTIRCLSIFIQYQYTSQSPLSPTNDPTWGDQSTTKPENHRLESSKPVQSRRVVKTI